jgi:hypothetical protein
MGTCMCKGVKLSVIGLILVANEQSWLWQSMSGWLVLGIILIILGILKAIWPCGCPVHGACKPSMPVKKAGRRR